MRMKPPSPASGTEWPGMSIGEPDLLNLGEGGGQEAGLMGLQEAWVMVVRKSNPTTCCNVVGLDEASLQNWYNT